MSTQAYQMSDAQELDLYRTKKILGLVSGLSAALGPHGNTCTIDREALQIFCDLLKDLLPDSTKMPYSEIVK